MTKEYSISSEVREIVVRSIRAVASAYTLDENWPKKRPPNLSTVTPEFRRMVLEDAAYVAEMKVLEDPERGGLNKEGELELFRHTDQMRKLAERLKTG